MRNRHRIARQVHEHSARLGRAVQRWWRSHRQRMTDEPGYAPAFTAVFLGAVELLTESRRVRYLVHELVRLYVAVLRVLAPRLGWDAY